MKKDVIIVGGGIGGLCSGIYLLHKGFNVTIVEQKEKLGGKINIIEEEGFKFDLSASILMTPKIYTDVFEDVGKNYKDYFEIINLDPLYKVFSYDKKSLLVYGDNNKIINEFEKFEKGLSLDFMKFLSKSYEKYYLIKNDFLDKPMINLKELLNLNSIKSLIKIKPLSTTSNYLNKIIKNEIIINYLIFSSMYIGVDPYKNSNIHTLIPAISHLNGLGYIKGGMYKYIESLEKLFKELGGKVLNNTKVDKVLIENNKIRGIKYKDNTLRSDIVICNNDYTYTVKNLIDKKYLDKRYNKDNIEKKDYSCSVFILYLGLDKIYDTLQVHNIYLNKNFQESIQSAFKGIIPTNPSLYIYYPSIRDKSFCKNNKSSLNIMLRIPNLSLYKSDYNKEDIKKTRDIIIKTIKQIPSMEDIEKHIVYENYLTPKTLEKDYNCYMGNAFGLSHKLLQNIYFRPHIKSKKVEGLYFLNASTHPGNGASVVIGGSKVLSELIYKDYKK